MSALDWFVERANELVGLPSVGSWLARAGREAGSELQGRTPRLCLLFGVLNAAHRSYYLAFLPACLICPKQATFYDFC